MPFVKGTKGSDGQLGLFKGVAPARVLLEGVGVSEVVDMPAFVDFFAGSGLVTEGMNGVFRAVWANDISPKKAAVYTMNHGAEHFHLGSIVDVRGAELPTAQLAWGSFPCQDLSLAGLAGGIYAERSGLVWQWLRVIDEMTVKPRILVAENVVGLVSSAGGAYYRALHTALTDRGYQVGAVLLDAARWVPQSRPRIFVIAIDESIAPTSEHVDDGPNWLHSEPIRRVAEGLRNWIWWRMPEPEPRRSTLADIVEWDAPFTDQESEARNLRLISPRHRVTLDALDRDEHFVVPGYRRTRDGKQVLELRFDHTAGCLRTPEGGSSRQVLVFKKNGELRSRLVTVRETARLMGVRDSYLLPGSYNDGYKAMGDAVAVPVVRWLAMHLLRPLLTNDETRRSAVPSPAFS
jgi:DNA (cytosine-5)-methyltransferase 1